MYTFLTYYIHYLVKEAMFDTAAVSRLRILKCISSSFVWHIFNMQTTKLADSELSEKTMDFSYLLSLVAFPSILNKSLGYIKWIN